jgi:hypothetical protein
MGEGVSIAGCWAGAAAGTTTSEAAAGVAGSAIAGEAGSVQAASSSAVKNAVPRKRDPVLVMRKAENEDDAVKILRSCKDNRICCAAGGNAFVNRLQTPSVLKAHEQPAKVVAVLVDAMVEFFHLRLLQ